MIILLEIIILLRIVCWSYIKHDVIAQKIDARCRETILKTKKAIIIPIIILYRGPQDVTRFGENNIDIIYDIPIPEQILLCIIIIIIIIIIIVYHIIIIL